MHQADFIDDSAPSWKVSPSVLETDPVRMRSPTGPSPTKVGLPASASVRDSDANEFDKTSFPHPVRGFVSGMLFLAQQVALQLC